MFRYFQPAASSYNATNAVPLETMNALSLAQAAEIFSAGSRVFELTIADDDVNFLVFGCQGENNSDQRKVAMRMLEYTKTHLVHFALTTGDNVYPHGARSPEDENFKKYFYNYYNELPFPIMVTLGNHDGNYSKIATYSIGGYSMNLKLLNPTTAYQEISSHGFQGLAAPSTGEQTEQNEVLHTFLGDIKEKISTLTQHALTIKELNDAKLKWVMPAQYYSYFIGKVQFIHLNSNTLVKDFLLLSQDNNTNNQASWLLKTYTDALAAGRKIIFVQHHSLFTCGKRVFHGDQHHYLSHLEIEAVKALLEKENINYNDMLLHLFKRYQIRPDLILSAHDHSLYYYNNAADQTNDYKIAQVISGGGGGKLQDRESFSESPHVPMFLKQTGFCHLSFNQHQPDEILIHFHTKKHHITFSSQHAEPIRPTHHNSDAERLRTATLSACQLYLAFIDERQKEFHGKFFSTSLVKISLPSNITHTMSDINKLHDLMAYLNQAAGLPNFKNILLEIKLRACSFSNLDSKNSFKNLLDDILANTFRSEQHLLNDYFGPHAEPSSSVKLT